MDLPGSASKRTTSHNSVSNTLSARCQLLVSVRDSREARICLDAGVDWIDLKEPTAGSLGMPSLDVAEQVAEILQDFPRRSVALGELHELSERAHVQRLSELFSIVKVGLSRMGTDIHWPDKLRQLSESLRATLVPVIYADWTQSAAPSPDDVVRWAADHESPYILVDTFFKDGRRLLDHLDFNQLSTMCQGARGAGIQVVLAGSLAVVDLPRLMELPCTAVAIRGAVCKNSRMSELCPDKVEAWVDAIGQKNLCQSSVVLD